MVNLKICKIKVSTTELYSNMSFENQVALITGATSRIGYACVKYLLQNGVKVR